MSHICIRIYANGSAKYTVRDDEGLAKWVEFNKEFRPGNTLVVDGTVVQNGYMSGTELEAIVKFAVKQKLPNPEVRQLARQFDIVSKKHYLQYPDDSILI